MAGTEILSGCVEFLSKAHDQRRPKTLTERVKAVLGASSSDGMRDIIRPSRQGAEVGLGIYLIVAAALGVVVWRSHDPVLESMTAGFYSIKWMTVFAGSGMLLYTTLQTLWFLLSHMAQAVFTPERFDLGYSHWEILACALKVKDEVIQMDLPPAILAYFMGSIDKAESILDLAWLLRHAKCIQERQEAAEGGHGMVTA